jgi:uncharacterized protein (TIGR02246 family)
MLRLDRLLCLDEPSSLSTMNRSDDDIRAIRQLAADWRRGWLAGDVELLLSLYADEPVLMPEGHPAVIGKVAIRSQYQSVLGAYDFSSEGRVMDVEVSGDLGYWWSAYRLTATPKSGGNPVHVAGKSVFIVRRGLGGTWKITRLIDNSDGEDGGR